MSRDDQAEQTESQADCSPSTQTIRQSTTIPVAVARYVECSVNNNQLTKIITQCNLGDPPGYDHDQAEQQSSLGDELCQAEQDGQAEQTTTQAEHVPNVSTWVPCHHYGEGAPLKQINTRACVQ